VGNQIISLSARSVRVCDVSAIGIRLDRVMYGGADISDIRGIGGKQFASVQEWDPVPHCPGSHSFLNQNRKDWYKCYDLTSLASTQVGRCVLVPEGRRILAGGSTTGTASAQPPSPERATDQAWSIAPAGAGSLFGLFPVVLPPANIRCASGTKICVDTIETSSWPLRGLCQSWLVRFRFELAAVIISRPYYLSS